MLDLLTRTQRRTKLENGNPPEPLSAGAISGQPRRSVSFAAGQQWWWGRGVGVIHRGGGALPLLPVWTENWNAAKGSEAGRGRGTQQGGRP